MYCLVYLYCIMYIYTLCRDFPGYDFPAERIPPGAYAGFLYIAIAHQNSIA